MTIPTAPPPPAEPAAPTPGAPRAPRGAERFLLWVAGLGVVRTDGWLGGVAAGIAIRLRIDPLIVRGILVVAALFGLPALFLYALAWAVLPDVDGRVHLRDLLQRRYDPVQLGILAMAVIGLFPTAPLTGRLFGLGYDGWSALSTFTWVVGLILAAALLFLIVRAARRTPGASAPDLPGASADPAAPAASAPLAGSGPATGADATPPAPTTPETAPTVPVAPLAANVATDVLAIPVPPAPLPPGTQDPVALEAWRVQHAAWKEQDQAWRRQQQDAERAARDQLRRERQAEAAEFAAAAAERRRLRRASNPRAGFAFVIAALGLAIVVGAGVGLAVGEGLGGALGLLSGALVLALSMILAGALRRRSGALAFATVVTLAAGLVTGFLSTMPGVTLGYASLTNNQEAQVRQPFGDLYLELYPHDGGPRPIEIEKGSGRTEILVDAGVQLQLRGTVGDDVEVSWIQIDPDDPTVMNTGTYTPTPRGDENVLSENISVGTGSPRTIQPVTIEQASGVIVVTLQDPEEGQE
ncbi:PspC domain-containing protein [Microbacterium sp. BLY]|uniref:PspC domain-containing protein n=1 Tax=Microbacterium sp. BLY TaxID=2823280 RepID=UPI001B344729|nr:PspC domain-containing protein [Microbacterium sp. BLY]MBP3976292.1 PspC domain-containing protein [Microbacterium sp. BLY]